MQREDNWFERVNFPIGIEGGGNTGHCPTENLVESYEMQASGLPVAPDAGYEHMDQAIIHRIHMKEGIPVCMNWWPKTELGGYMMSK